MPTEKQLRLMLSLITGLTVFGYVAFGFLLGVLACAYQLGKMP